MLGRAIVGVSLVVTAVIATITLYVLVVGWRPLLLEQGDVIPGTPGESLLAFEPVDPVDLTAGDLVPDPRPESVDPDLARVLTVIVEPLAPVDPDAFDATVRDDDDEPFVRVTLQPIVDGEFSSPVIVEGASIEMRRRITVPYVGTAKRLLLRRSVAVALMVIFAVFSLWRFVLTVQSVRRRVSARSKRSHAKRKVRAEARAVWEAERARDREAAKARYRVEPNATAVAAPPLVGTPVRDLEQLVRAAVLAARKGHDVSAAELFAEAVDAPAPPEGDRSPVRMLELRALALVGDGRPIEANALLARRRRKDRAASDRPPLEEMQVWAAASDPPPELRGVWAVVNAERAIPS